MKKDNISFKNCNSQSVKDYIDKITKPIFEKALKETPKNRMSVGGGSVKAKKFSDVSLYQPHNYRLYFDFLRSGFKPPTHNTTDPSRSVVTTSYEYKVKNSTEHYFKNYHGCNITVKKTQIEIINKLEHKRWYVIKHGEASEYTAQVRTIIEKKDSECVIVLKKFIAEFGGESNFKVLNRKSEDKVQLEDSVDRVGLKNHFHSGACKKVYNAANIEFKDPVFAANYFENRAIEKITPEVLVELNRLYQLISIKLDGLSFLKENFRVLDDLKKYESIIMGLNAGDKQRFHDWVFEMFCIGGDLCLSV